jgi:hypothetical protein
MKIGVRKPSLRKMIAARTSPRRWARHSLSLLTPRGMGWLANPKRALYDRVDDRTTVSMWALLRRFGQPPTRWRGQAGEAGARDESTHARFRRFAGPADNGRGGHDAQAGARSVEHARHIQDQGTLSLIASVKAAGDTCVYWCCNIRLERDYCVTAQ